MSAQVISMLGFKGGVGRTVVGMLLATALARRQLKVVVIDAHSHGNPFWLPELSPLMTGISPGLMQNTDGSRRELAAVVKEHSHSDVIIIDTPSNQDDPVNEEAAEVAHLVLAPMPLGVTETWAAGSVVDFIKRIRRKKNPGLLFAGVVNMSKRTKVATMCLQKLRETEDLPLLNAGLNDRQAYRGTASILRLRDKLAIRETEALADEVLELLASRSGARPQTARRTRAGN